MHVGISQKSSAQGYDLVSSLGSWGPVLSTTWTFLLRVFPSSCSTFFILPASSHWGDLFTKIMLAGVFSFWLSGALLGVLIFPWCCVLLALGGALCVGVFLHLNHVVLPVSFLRSLASVVSRPSLCIFPHLSFLLWNPNKPLTTISTIWALHTQICSVCYWTPLECCSCQCAGPHQCLATSLWLPGWVCSPWHANCKHWIPVWWPLTPFLSKKNLNFSVSTLIFLLSRSWSLPTSLLGSGWWWGGEAQALYLGWHRPFTRFTTDWEKFGLAQLAEKLFTLGVSVPHWAKNLAIY